MAQQDKTTFENTFNDSGTGLFKDNTTGLIGADDVRTLVTNVTDSFLNKTDEQYNGIKGLKPGISTIANLKAITTASLDTSIYQIFRDTASSDVLRVYELVSGTDAEASPNIIRPNDYAASTNEKVWKLSSLGSSLNQTVVSIGDWNMDSTDNISVAHGLSDFTKIRNLSAIIISDNGANYTSLQGISIGGTGLGSLEATSTNIQLYRTTGGAFDTTNYDSTSFNRGFIYIVYTS